MKSTQQQIGFEVKGVTPYIQNAFSQKSIEQILSKHMGMPTKREPKVPRDVIRNALIRNTAGQIVVPAVAIKTAMITGSVNIKSLDKKKTQLQVAMHVEGQGLPVNFTPSDSAESQALGIDGVEPRMDLVRLSTPGRTPDVRFRPEIPAGWTVKFVATFGDAVTPHVVTQLVDYAGRVGVGEWRPECGGTFGQFEVVRVLDEKELDAVIAASSIPLVTPRIPAWALDAGIDDEALQRMFDGTAAGVAEGGDGVKSSLARKPAKKNGAEDAA